MVVLGPLLLVLALPTEMEKGQDGQGSDDHDSHNNTDGDGGGLVGARGLFAEVDIGSRMAFGFVVFANDQMPGYPAKSDGKGVVIHGDSNDLVTVCLRVASFSGYVSEPMGIRMGKAIVFFEIVLWWWRCFFVIISLSH